MLGYVSRSTPGESGAWNPRTETRPMARSSSRSCPNRARSSSWAPARTTCSRRWGGTRSWTGQPGGPRWYAHAFIVRNPGTATDAQDVNLRLRRGLINIRLRRGQTVKGRVIGPDGQPIQDA